MSRAIDVITGVALIISLWAWMLKSFTGFGPPWLFVVIILCKISAACFITAPVYREYLR